jgi:hypothetical protein
MADEGGVERTWPKSEAEIVDGVGRCEVEGAEEVWRLRVISTMVLAEAISASG